MCCVGEVSGRCGGWFRCILQLVCLAGMAGAVCGARSIFVGVAMVGSMQFPTGQKPIERCLDVWGIATRVVVEVAFSPPFSVLTRGCFVQLWMMSVTRLCLSAGRGS